MWRVALTSEHLILNRSCTPNQNTDAKVDTGKHKGRSMIWILEKDGAYIDWLRRRAQLNSLTDGSIRAPSIHPIKRERGWRLEGGERGSWIGGAGVKRSVRGVK